MSSIGKTSGAGVTESVISGSCWPPLEISRLVSSKTLLSEEPSSKKRSEIEIWTPFGGGEVSGQPTIPVGTSSRERISQSDWLSVDSEFVGCPP